MTDINNNDLTIDVTEKVPFKKALPLSFQHLFAMFGSSI